MAKAVFVPNGIITIVDVDFECPECGKGYGEDFYYKQLRDSKHGIISKKCKGCGERLGITTDIKGDVKVWRKRDEEKY